MTESMATDVEVPVGSNLQRSVRIACLAAHAAEIRPNMFVAVHTNNVEPVVCRVVHFRLIVVATVVLLTLHC